MFHVLGKYKLCVNYSKGKFIAHLYKVLYHSWMFPEQEKYINKRSKYNKYSCLKYKYKQADQVVQEQRKTHEPSPPQSLFILTQIIVAIDLLFQFMCMCNANVTFPKQKHVVVTNDLGGDLSLAMNCNSNKEGDLGLHVLPPHCSYEYDFRFSTDIYCNWKWTNEFHEFNIFIQPQEKP